MTDEVEARRFGPAESLAFAFLCLLFRIRGLVRPRRAIVYYHWLDFERKAEAIADALRRRGIRTEMRLGYALMRRAEMKASSDLWIGFWNLIPLELLPRKYVFINSEPLEAKAWAENRPWFDAMSRARQVWGYREADAATVDSMGVPFAYVPFGYSPWYEEEFRRNTAGKQLPQDIDVLFFGSVSGRREAALKRLADAGVKVCSITRTNPHHGVRLDEVLARSKIILNVHLYDEPEHQIRDFARLDYLLSNKLFVLHERPSAIRKDPEFEQHVATCTYEDITRVCLEYLARPEERARSAATAYEWFKSAYPLDRFVPYDAVQELLRRPALSRSDAPAEREVRTESRGVAGQPLHDDVPAR
jgi:hypothetical protein